MTTAAAPASTSDGRTAREKQGDVTPTHGLEHLFRRVATMVREEPSVAAPGAADDATRVATATTVTTNQEKLRLYGLYKYVCDGPCSNDRNANKKEPSVLQPVARAKYLAWKETCVAGREDAMREYIETVARRQDVLGNECRTLWNGFCQEQSTRNQSDAAAVVQDTRRSDVDDITAANSTSDNDNSRTSNKKNVWEDLLRYFGGQPLIPRGRLDISNRDLHFAVQHCCGLTTHPWKSPQQQYQQLRLQISELWSRHSVTKDAPESIVVGLSVRSLFDLHLTMKLYPADSEILIVPSITVPAMIHVASYHRLRMVPVDIADGASPQTREWIHVDAVRSKITSHTVAIMVVHPFGMVTTNDETFMRLRQVADQHGLEIWEDCAECFTGLGGGGMTSTSMDDNLECCCYLGHPTYADVRFFSFGNIKTATALGGGIAIFRQSESARHVERLQNSLYTTQQSSRDFLGRVIVAMFLNFLAESPVRVGFLALLCKLSGLDFDAMITRAVRGFRASSKTCDNQPAHKFICQIRKRPSNALLALLYRRLEQSTHMAPTIPARINRCKLVESMLRHDVPNVVFPDLPTHRKTYWAFPICCSGREKISQFMRDSGLDVTTGASQLCSVSTFLNQSRHNHDACPKTESLMDSVLYLPVTSQLLCDASLKRLMKSLQSATKNSSSSEQYRNFNTSRRRKNFSIPLSLAAAVLTLIVSAAIFGWDMLVCILGCFISLLFVRSSAEYLLHWTTSRFYLKESTAFAENCDMIDTRPSTGVNMGNDDKIDSKPRQAVLSSIGALKLATTPVDNGRTVIVTGATGFVGSCLLRDLLQHRDMLSLKRIIAICRKKGESSAQCRVSNLLSTPLFESFADSKWGEIIEVVEGDVTKEFAGLAPMDLARICQDETITHIFNCAAAVSFTQELSDAARSNVTSALNMQALAVRLKNNAKFVHVSTSFVHGDLTGSCDSPLPEKLFSFGPFDPVEVYKSMLDTQYYASKALAELGFHNTYSFSKSVCEHLLALQNGVNTIIIRPSIVGPAMETPFEGWAGEKPSTIVAGPCLHLSCQWNIWFLGRQKVSCVPVDVLARYVIAKAFDDHLYSEPSSVSDVASSSDGSFEHVSRINDQSSDFEEVASTASSSGSCCHHIRIFNATWNDNENQKASFSWLEFSVAYLHLGSVLGYFSRSSALLQLLISAQILPEIVPNNQNLFQLLHRTFVRAPLEYFRSVCEWTGVSTNRISKLLVFLDLPLLFFPFVKRDFFFESELFAPDDFDAQRYGFSCGVAAHRFISSKTAEAPKLAIQRLSCLVIGGKICPHKSFLGWAFAQPKGKFLVRVVAAVIGWFLKKISTVVTVDVISFQSTIAAMKKREDDCTLVLTPTHRSFLDFILLSFAVFSVPEMHIDLPFIVASNEFENLPLIGTLASLLGAFYIRRGRDSADKALAARLRSLKEHDGATCIEVFIEGKRSRDRRFERPKNGVLKCLKESGGDHVIVPVTINYERIPEQEILSEEASGGARNSLNVFGLLGWMKEAAKGNVQIGKIHIGASDPIFLDCKSDQEFSHLVKNIQIQQQHEVVVSEYHVMAAAKLFEVPQTEMRNAMIHLGCRFWPETAITDLPDLPSDTSSLLSITLQWSHVLAPLFADSRKDWSMWLNWTPVRDSTSLRNTVKDLDLSSLALRERLAKFFDSAEVIVQESILKLIATGFEEPSLEHIFQTSKSMSQEDIPLPILYAAASMAASEINKRDYPSLAMIDNVVQNSTSTSAGEKLGFWGFDDSGFVIRIDVQGRRHVTMKGVRYSLCGRSLRRLLPFMESALQVKVDLSKEFVSAAPLWHADVETNLSNQDQAFLVDVFQARISLSMIERTRHGSGHSQEDVMSLRMAERVRVPDAVVWPLSEDEVTILITAANTHGWCLIPFGGGTNVTGATKCPSREKEPRPIISVDMRRMNRVLCLNEEDGLAHVEAGIVGQDLVNLLASRGYTMGHEPDSLEFSTLGGWIATKASGMKRSKYGNIEDIVKSTRMVGLNGVLWKGSASSDKTCAGRVAEGMGVSSFALGSEGCLGIITSAVIRVWPLPETKQYSGILFPDFQSGLQFVRALSRQPSKMPACVRLLDNAHFRMGQALKPDHLTWLESVQEVISRSWLYVAACGKDMDPERVVCATICFEGATTEVREQIQTVNTLVNRFGGIQLGSKAGKAGYELTYMIAYLRDFAMTYHILGESFETFAPWSKIETLVAATKDRLLKEHSKRLLPGVPFVGCRVTQLYHEGACLYFYLCMSFYGVKRSSHIFAELEKAARDEILKQGGSLSHHHGLGKLRSSFVQDRTSPAFRQVVAAVKESMDKNNIFGAHNGLFADVEKGGESSES